jgi:HD superfamily phosphohydrolase
MPAKTFRDPVHGDITVGRIQLGLIDSDPFQRLRYIRQNGLLHMIFPGAVHTRFAHSIGTMHIAQRVFSHLFPAYRVATEVFDSSTVDWDLRYAGTVFELAALLHDIGHCAFSHSIERIDDDIEAERIFRPLGKFVSRWTTAENNLYQWWQERVKKAEAWCEKKELDWLTAPKHEEIGLLLAYMAFHEPPSVYEGQRHNHVRLAFESAFPESLAHTHDITFNDLVDDVIALMRGETEWMPMTTRMLRALKSIAKDIMPPKVNECSQYADDIFNALHSLISGTIDVDRMDYLLRDTKFAGTVIGKYDLDLLINSLSFRYSAEENSILLCLSERAKGAVDDFLWSRWQLYLQIINHKANVMLNALFPAAFSSAMRGVDLEYYHNILLFTDDEVMATVRRLFHETTKRDNPALMPAKFAFLRNSLPKYLDVIDIEEGCAVAEEGERVRENLSRLSKLFFIDEEYIIVERTESTLIKERAVLPRVLRKIPLPDGESRLEILPAQYLTLQWKQQHRPTRVRHVHFFTQHLRNRPPGGHEAPKMGPAAPSLPKPVADKPKSRSIRRPA